MAGLCSAGFMFPTHNGAAPTSCRNQTEPDRCALEDSRSCDLPRGVFGRGNDLVGSRIENEVLAGHE